MKLIRLKLNSNYRSLENGFEISFDNNDYKSSLNPICFVGPNGSGKSNILEALADIFYYLDAYFLGYVAGNTDFVMPIDAFEIEYYQLRKFVLRSRPENDYKIPSSDFYHLKVIKLAGTAPEFFINTPKGFTKLNYGTLSEYLPTKIWGYTSGHNELLSVPFLKMDFYYLQDLEDNKTSGLNRTVDENRLHFVDYTTCSSILLSNFLMYDNNIDRNKLNIFNDKFGIEKITKFKFTVRYNYWTK